MSSPLLLAATVWSFAHFPLGLSNRNTCISSRHAPSSSSWRQSIIFASFVLVPKMPKHLVQQHGWLLNLVELKISIKPFNLRLATTFIHKLLSTATQASSDFCVAVVRSLAITHWSNTITKFHKGFLVMRVVWVEFRQCDFVIPFNNTHFRDDIFDYLMKHPHCHNFKRVQVMPRRSQLRDSYSIQDRSHPRENSPHISKVFCG